MQQRESACNASHSCQESNNPAFKHVIWETMTFLHRGAVAQTQPPADANDCTNLLRVITLQRIKINALSRTWEKRMIKILGVTLIDIYRCGIIM